MKNLFKTADDYLHTLKWQDFSIIKFCLISLGVLSGASVAKKDRDKTTLAAAAIFIVTYLVAMGRFIKFIKNDRR